jgi:hypothetical protein
MNTLKNALIFLGVFILVLSVLMWIAHKDASGDPDLGIATSQLNFESLLFWCSPAAMVFTCLLLFAKWIIKTALKSYLLKHRRNC